MVTSVLQKHTSATISKQAYIGALESRPIKNSNYVQELKKVKYFENCLKIFQRLFVVLVVHINDLLHLVLGAKEHTTLIVDMLRDNLH